MPRRCSPSMLELCGWLVSLSVLLALAAGAQAPAAVAAATPGKPSEAPGAGAGSLDGPYAAAINDYLRRELGYESDLVYERLAKVWPWSFDGYENQYVNVAEPLRQEMVKNPALRVLITSGVFDLATPYFDAVYTVDHMGLPPALKGHIQITRYQSGHMIYIRRSEQRKFKDDIARFLRGVTADAGRGGGGGNTRGPAG